MRVALLLSVVVVVSVNPKRLDKSEVLLYTFSCGKDYYRVFLLEHYKRSLYVGTLNKVFRLDAEQIDRSRSVSPAATHFVYWEYLRYRAGWLKTKIPYFL